MRRSSLAADRSGPNSAGLVLDGTPSPVYFRSPVNGAAGLVTSTVEDQVKRLVELRGFEPLTPSLRTRCSAELSYSP